MARDERAKQAGIPSFVDAQRDFGLGQIDADARRRDDTKLLGQSAKTITNWRPMPVGGLESRPGTENVKFYTQAGRIDMIRALGKRLHTAVFLPTVVEFLNEFDSLVTNVTGCPWSAGDLDVMRWTQAEDTFVVVATGWQPQVLAYDGTNWARSNFRFREEVNGQKRQAYYRFEADGVTMKPSARTGTITVDFSPGGFLKSGHIGARFRYGERELQINSLVNSSRANASVINQLPISFKTWVTNTRGLRVGDRIQGSESGAYGEVTAIDTGSPEFIKVTLYRVWSGFERDEWAVGPNWRAQIIAPGDGSNRDHQQVIDPEPITTWDEQFMSDARGWPGCVRFAGNRLIFSAFPQVPNAVLMSAPTLLTDFLIGADPNDAILELIPGNVEVYDLVDYQDIIISTNAGIYYIPITSLTPGATVIRKIGPDGVTNTAPAVTSDGVAFLSTGKNRVIGVRPQDDEEHPYKIVDLTELHSRIVKAGTRVAASSGDAASSGRFVYLLKGDPGQITMGRPIGEAFGWFPWTFNGDIRDISAYGSELRFLVKYANNVFGLERVVEAATLDGQIALSQSTRLQNYSGKTATVAKDGKDMGSYTVAANGTLTGYSGGNSGAVAGFPFMKKIVKVPNNHDAGQPDGQRERRRRKIRAWVDVGDQVGGFTFEGRIIPEYLPGENTNQAPIGRNTKYTRRMLGRTYEPEITLQQDGARSMKVLEIGAEVTI